MLWPFSQAWDTVEPTLKTGYSVVIEPTYSGATRVLALALCLTIFNVSPTQNTRLFDAGVCCVRSKLKMLVDTSRSSTSGPNSRGNKAAANLRPDQSSFGRPAGRQAERFPSNADCVDNAPLPSRPPPPFLYRPESLLTCNRPGRFCHIPVP